MDISEVGINLLHDLAFKHGLQTQHTVSGRVLRADVDDIVVGVEQLVLLRLQVAVLVDEILQTVVGLVVVLQ